MFLIKCQICQAVVEKCLVDAGRVVKGKKHYLCVHSRRSTGIHRRESHLDGPPL